jgi:N-acetylmuramoyl-L-alanine amidase
MPNFFALLRGYCGLTFLGALLVVSLAIPGELAAATKKQRSSQSGKKSSSKQKGSKGGRGRKGGRSRGFAEPTFTVPEIRRGFQTVVIDAGHGGHDRGGIEGQVIAEKEIALDTAQRLEKLLQRSGFRTVMTRPNDEFVSLPGRVAMANAIENAVFVSVHYNASRNLDARGFETYYYHGAGYPLAARIHRNLLASIPTEDRGVRRRGFYVIRNSRIPAVLCECGFLTNMQEGNAALERGYRQKVAEAIARALVETRREGG